MNSFPSSEEMSFPKKFRQHSFIPQIPIVEKWLSNPYNSQMIVIKYENLIENTERELQRFCSFVDEKRDESYLKMIAKKTSFATMRQKEIDLGWEDQYWPKDKYLVRRGKIGSYKDEMPKDVLDIFMSESKDTIEKCGYSIK